MSKRFHLSHKSQKKSWDSSEIDQGVENRKIGFVLLGVIVIMVLMAVFMWWIKQSLNG